MTRTALAVARTPATIARTAVGSARTAASGQPYPGVVLMDRPVAYFRLGEASGNIRDLVAGAPGVKAGTPTYAQTGALTGDSNTAILFNGTTDLFSIVSGAGTIRDLDASPATIECWAKFVSFNSGNNGLVCRPAGCSFGAASTGAVKLGLEGGGNFTGVGGQIVLSTWYHLVAVVNGASSMVYVNGVGVSAGTINMVATNNSWFIAAENASPTIPSNAVIDEVALYGYALTAGQVLNHYNLATGLTHRSIAA